MPAARRIIIGSIGQRVPTYRQHAGEKLDYEFLFGGRLETGEAIASVAVVQTPEGGLVQSDQSNTTTSVTLYLAEGTPDRAYQLEVKVTTDAAVPRIYSGRMRLEVLPA